MAGGVVGLPPLSATRLLSPALRKRLLTGSTASPVKHTFAASCALHDLAETPSEATEALALTPALVVSETRDTLALSGAPLEQTFFEKLWTNYLILLEEKPILVKSCTSLFGFLIGDICAQLIIGADYDVYRTLRMTLFGILMDGPIGHCWYLCLDKNVMPETPTVPKAVIIKTLLDQLVWAPFFSCVFFTFNQTMQV